MDSVHSTATPPEQERNDAECREPTDNENVVLPLPTHKLEHVWTWFAHTTATSCGYKSATVELGNFETLNDFFRYYNNVPFPSRVFCGCEALYLPKVHGGCYVTGYAIFRDGVLPMWEDNRNTRGCDVCARFSYARDNLVDLWFDATTSLVTGSISDNILGLRLVYRTDRRTGDVTQKLEFWLEDHNVVVAQCALARIFPRLQFDVVAPTVALRSTRRGRRRM